MTMDLSGFVKRKAKIEIGSKIFTFTELTMRDLAEFRNWLMERREANADKRRERLLEEAKTIGDIEPLEILKYIDKPLSEEEVDAEMETTDGMGYLAYLSLKAAQPGVSLEQALMIITPANTEKISAAMFPKPNTEKKTTRKRQPVK